MEYHKAMLEGTAISIRTAKTRSLSGIRFAGKAVAVECFTNDFLFGRAIR